MISRFLRCMSFFAVLFSILHVASPRQVTADIIRKIPVLVNWQGYAENPPSIDDPDADADFSAEALDEHKGRLERAIKDANKVLEQCKEHTSNEFRLANIQHKNHPLGRPSPKSKEQEEDDFDKDTKFGKTELASTFKKQMGEGKQLKGQKINMVQSLPGDDEQTETMGKGRNGEPVMWIDVNSLFEPIAQLPGQDESRKPVAGPVIVHELLHNAGLKEHTGADGNVFNEKIDLFKSNQDPNVVVDRNLTKPQCEVLDKYFKTYGISAPNEKQKIGFVPENEGLEEKTHYAVVTKPAPETIATPHLGMLEYSMMDDGNFIGRLSWDSDLSSETPLALGVSVAIEGLDAFVQIALSSQGDGVLSAQGTSTIGGITAPISRLDIHDGGLDSDVDSILDFEFRVLESSDSDLFVETSVVDEASNNEQFLSALLENVSPPPSLHGFPVTVGHHETIGLAGEGFDAMEQITFFVDEIEVGDAVADENFSFTASVSIPELEAGDYLFEAVGSSQAFAVGVITVVPEPTSLTLLASAGCLLIAARRIYLH